ncbi:hypothetical protein OG800_50310 (plasmid) [Streptomyces sp. NBC_00445]|uniref:hypothetical protein n=1 Tax=Streptomyces sp. NBC_00445 TaxID=2975745 RepID=UPI002E24D983
MTAQELEPVFAEVLAAWPAVVERARGHGISLDDLYGHEEGRPRMGRFDQMIHVGFASRTDDTAEAVHEGLNRVLSVWWSQESRYYVHVWRNCIRLDEDGVYRPYVSRRFPGHQPCPPSPA